jgi:hypothetical protein
MPDRSAPQRPSRQRLARARWRPAAGSACGEASPFPPIASFCRSARLYSARASLVTLSRRARATTARRKPRVSCCPRVEARRHKLPFRDVLPSARIVAGAGRKRHMVLEPIRHALLIARRQRASLRRTAGRGGPRARPRGAATGGHVFCRMAACDLCANCGDGGRRKWPKHPLDCRHGLSCFVDIPSRIWSSVGRAT